MPRPSAPVLSLAISLLRFASASPTVLPKPSLAAWRTASPAHFAPRRRLMATAASPPEVPEAGAQLATSEPSGAGPVGERISAVAAPSWRPGMRRTGVLARKKGMTSLWDSNGIRVPLTVLELEDTQVVGHKKPPHDNYYAVQVGCSDRRSLNHIPHAQQCWFERQGVPPKHEIAEFQVDGEDALVPIGTDLSAAHFVVGQHVDVKSMSKGKGFQGVMKRWGFSGGNASHGSTKHHRKAGSTGQNQDPGRVWPGKKMAGRMGFEPIITQSLLVARVDTASNLLFVKGCVPGPNHTFVRVWDAEKKVTQLSVKRAKAGLWRETAEVLPGVKGLPFPALSREDAKGLPREITVAIAGSTLSP